jgi:hypothetical protein
MRNAYTGSLRYPAVYHAACAHLVAFGGHGGDTSRGRALCAAALRALRAIDRDMAQRERRTLYYISGQLPIKVQA